MPDHHRIRHSDNPSLEAAWDTLLADIDELERKVGVVVAAQAQADFEAAFFADEP
jgi:predicted secreted Zn-dependent protease